MLNNKFDVRMVGTNDRQTVFLEGELDLSATSEFRAVIEPLIHNKDKVLVLNLQNLRYIDSTGIGFIVSILKARNELGAPFLVEEIPVKIRRLLDMTGITPYLVQ